MSRLSVRILVAVALGVVTARVLGPHALPLVQVATAIVALLKALAGPLVFFAVVDALQQHEIPPRQGARLVALSTLNAVVAIGIGLGVAHTLHLGTRWHGRIEALVALVPPQANAPTPSARPTLDPLANVAQYLPENLVEPFARNNVITIVLLALAIGIALRRLSKHGDASTRDGVQRIQALVRAGLQLFLQLLEWVVAIVPVAVFAIVAGMVARAGLRVFAALAPFLLTVLLGMLLHVTVYYAVVLRVLGGRSVWALYRGGFDAIATALSTGSSLATLPVTLRCLHDKLRVSDENARLAAAVGTNLNHDGIILYEAGAAIFVTQAIGTHLGIGQQLAIALAAVMAGVGIAGVPEAGLITLPLVLAAAGVAPDAVTVIIPLLFSVDWIVGRFRAATNVISDMTVAVVLDHAEARDRAREPNG